MLWRIAQKFADVLSAGIDSFVWVTVVNFPFRCGTARKNIIFKKAARTLHSSSLSA
jgi:hypothetical protein